MTAQGGGNGRYPSEPSGSGPEGGSGNVAHVRFVVIAEQPLAVVDLESAGDEQPLALDQSVFRTLVDRGLLVLPRFYGHALPQGARVGFTLAPEELRLEDEQETRLLRVPRAGVDPVWLAAALRLKGTRLYAGRDLGVDPDATPKQLCDLLDASARQGRLAGAIVGVAEPRQGLPIF